MAYIVSSIPPFYSNNTSAPSTFYPSYNSPFYPSYTTNTPPSPNHFYPSEVTTPNLSASYYNYGSEGYSSYRSNYPIFDGKEDAYGWVLCIEKHFKENSTPEAMKLPEAVLALTGLPRQWYFWWSQNHPYAGWEAFVSAFIWRFKPEFRDVLPISDHEEEPTSFENYTDISKKDFAINSKPPQPTDVTPCPFPSSPPPPPKLLIVDSFPSSPSPPQQQSDHNLFSPPPQLPLDEPEPEKEKIDEEESKEKTEPEGQTEALACAPPPPPKPPEFNSLTEHPDLLLDQSPSPVRLPPSPVPSRKPPDPSGPQAPTEFQSTPSRLPPLKPPDQSFNITVQDQPWVTPTPTLPPPEPPDDVVVLTPTPSFLPDSKHQFQNFNATLSKFGLIFSVLYKPTKLCPTLFDSQRIFEMQSQPLASRTIHVLPCDSLAACHVYVPFLNFLWPLHSNIPAKFVCICCLTTRVRSNSFIAVLGEMTNQSALPLLQKAIVSSFMEKKVGPCDAYNKTIKSLAEYPLVTQIVWPKHHHYMGNVQHKRAHLSFQNLQVSTKLAGLSKFGWLTTFKTWDPGENFTSTMASSLQFKKWDPGKFLMISIFLQP